MVITQWDITSSPRTPAMPSQRWCNAGPASTTLAQHYISAGNISTPRVGDWRLKTTKKAHLTDVADTLLRRLDTFLCATLRRYTADMTSCGRRLAYNNVCREIETECGPWVPEVVGALWWARMRVDTEGERCGGGGGE